MNELVSSVSNAVDRVESRPIDFVVILKNPKSACQFVRSVQSRNPRKLVDIVFKLRDYRNEHKTGNIVAQD